LITLDTNSILLILCSGLIGAAGTALFFLAFRDAVITPIDLATKSILAKGGEIMATIADLKAVLDAIKTDTDTLVTDNAAMATSVDRIIALLQSIQGGGSPGDVQLALDEANAIKASLDSSASALESSKSKIDAAAPPTP